MAVTNKGSVQVVSANGDTISAPLTICGILYAPGSGSPSASIAIGGVTVWAASGSSRAFDDVEMRLDETATISMAGTGTILYLYTKVS